MTTQTFNQFFFLPESNFSIKSLHLDVDKLTRDEAAHYNSLAHDKLLEVNQDYFNHYHNRECEMSYTSNTGGETWTLDVFDLLTDKLDQLQESHFMMTCDEILSMLDQEFELSF